MLMSRPSRASGLKLLKDLDDIEREVSRPSRASGLKRPMAGGRRLPRVSRPSRASGLKQPTRQPHGGHAEVSPFTGEWIET